MNARDEETKRSASGKFDAGMHKQTVEQLKPLMQGMKNYVSLYLNAMFYYLFRLVILIFDIIWLLFAS